MFILFIFLFLWTLSPGPIMVLTINQARDCGQWAGISVAAGATCASGLILTAVLIAQWLGINLNLNGVNARSFEYVGAFLIVLFGVIIAYRTLFTKQKHDSSVPNGSFNTQGFWQGMLIVTASIPQSIIFYIILVPQSVPAPQVFSTILTLGLLKVALLFIWHAGIAVLTQRFQNVLIDSRLNKSFDFTLATILVFFGFSILI